MSAPTHESKSEAWDNNADFWVTIIRDKMDRYRLELTDEVVFSAAGDLAHKRVLDVACGEGYMVRRAQESGADAYGIDLCEPLIKAARDLEHQDRGDSHYTIGDMRDLPYGDDSFDLILANHAINEVSDPGRAFAEWSRVLRVGGAMVCMMLHPCFFDWKKDEGDYFQPHRVGAKPYNVAGLLSPDVASAHTAPLETYVNGIIASGMSITLLSEVRPPQHLIDSDEWWRRRSTSPHFMLLRAEVR